MVRARATHLNWDNSTTNTVTTLGVNAENKTIPEIDITYFFTKNIAAELVLSYPQRVEVFAGATSLNTVTALPQTILAQYHFTNFGPLKPYVGAGLNYTRCGSRELGATSTAITLKNHVLVMLYKPALIYVDQKLGYQFRCEVH